jgi:hypothetical protein
MLSRNKYVSTNGTIYHFGIIDYLQAWNFNKKAENCFKTRFGLLKNLDISAVDPERYKTRFINYFSNQMFRMNENHIEEETLNENEDEVHNMLMTFIGTGPYGNEVANRL